MRRMFGFVSGIGLGGLACLGAMNYHVVRAQDGFHLVGKQEARLGQVYVDTREFDATDWLEHPELIVSLRAANEQGLLNESAGLLRKGVQRLTDKAQQKVSQRASQFTGTGQQPRHDLPAVQVVR